MLFISSHGDILFSHLRSWNNRKTKACRPLNTKSGFASPGLLDLRALSNALFSLNVQFLSSPWLFFCFLSLSLYFSSSPVLHLLSLSGLYDSSFLFSFCSYIFHNFYLFWQLATRCLRKYFPKDCSSPPCQRKHFHGLKNYYLNKKEDMTATFCYASKNSQKTEMLIQIIAVCHVWIKLSNVK